MRGMGYKDFIQRDYKPSRTNDVICTFYVEPAAGVDFDWCAGAVAAESSIGTWDPELSTMSEEARKYGAAVFDMNPEQRTFKVAYPLDLFELGSFPQYLSSVTGNVYGLKEVKHLRLLDNEFPEKFVRAFKGPQLGLDGARKLTGVRDRPFFGTIIKPKLGLSADRWAQAAYDAWVGGLDIVKDDENLTSMTFNNFYDRAKKVVEMKKKAERETGEKKLYFCNISAPVGEMKKRADYLIGLGNEYVMIDILTVGWAGLQEMRDHLDGKGVGIHAHRAQHGAYTKLDYHGIDFMPIAQWARIAGCDNLHAGSVGAGKMFVEGGMSHAKKIYQFLQSDYHGLRKTLPIASGGLHPGVVPHVIQNVGKDIACMAGGGVHGHPQGSRAGAQAFRAAGHSLEDAAKKSPALAAALKKWGTKVVGGSE